MFGNDSDYENVREWIPLISIHEVARGFTCVPIEMMSSSIRINDLDNYPVVIGGKQEFED
jgi:NADH:ubiquinone oxidoreductase subunit B-like Fe-S oxidoreductase